MNPQNIRIDDYDYPLPESRIARFPLKQRDLAKLLYWNGSTIEDEVFRSVPSLLRKDSLLVFNDTKVIYARLFFHKSTGSKIEIFCLEPVEPAEVQVAFAAKGSVVFKCLIGNNKKWKQGPLVSSTNHNGTQIVLHAERLESDNECWNVRFSWDTDMSFAEILEICGVVPLPPYLDRESQEQDKTDYQTVYANYDGSVAAPTAGLHFTEQTLQETEQKGIATTFVTLHVGAGTFKPVSSACIGDHDMHVEKLSVSRESICKLIEHIDKDIVCVGTTSVRTIESLYWYGVRLMANKGEYFPMDIEQWEPYCYCEEELPSAVLALGTIVEAMDKNKLESVSGRTRLLIAPPYRYRVVKGIITNFHQPKSTLLLLVSALIGDSWREIYGHALDNGYRFLSYGDACLFMPHG